MSANDALLAVGGVVGVVVIIHGFVTSAFLARWRARREPDRWPKVTAAPASDDVVQVLMDERMARRFEERCLGSNTRGRTRLSLPLLFSEDDLPTYIIEVTDG